MRRPTLAEIITVYARSDGRCVLCSEPVDPDEATIDHIVPKSRGGEDAPENWQLAHRWCNTSKGPRLTGETAVPKESGQFAREWRVGRNMTQRNLADLLDVDPITISRWERDEQKPPGRLLDLALEALDWRQKFPDRSPR